MQTAKWRKSNTLRIELAGNLSRRLILRQLAVLTSRAAKFPPRIAEKLENTSFFCALVLWYEN